MDNQLPVVIFDLARPGNIGRALAGEDIGSTISTPGRNMPKKNQVNSGGSTTT